MKKLSSLKTVVRQMEMNCIFRRFSNRLCPVKSPVKIGLLAAVCVVVIVSAIHFLRIGKESITSPGASLQIGKTETHSSLSSSSSTCASEGAGFS